MRRRQFIKRTALSSLAVTLPRYGNASSGPAIKGLSLTDPIPIPSVRQTWLGSAFWGNRLQDWRVNDGRIECLQGGGSFEVRTVSLLTRTLTSSNSSGRLRIKLGVLTPGKKGFAGFLLGVGAGELDYRGASLAQRAAGENGGFMAVVNESGALSFRDFSAEKKVLAYSRMEQHSVDSVSSVPSPRSASWELDCTIKPTVSGGYEVTLALYDAISGERLNNIVSRNIAPQYLNGGVMLLSSPEIGENGTRWWFSDIRTSGDKIANHPERAVGPVLGCLHSLDATDPKNAILKLTAQLFPLNEMDAGKLMLEVFDTNDKTWNALSAANIGDGYAALFRVIEWDARVHWKYRLRFEGESAILFSGEIQPGITNGKAVSAALFSCILPTALGLDKIDYTRLLPQEAKIGRYTTDNILFPHTRLVNHCEQNEPDIYLFCGDQYYETFPTRSAQHTQDAKLDTLYRWYLWLWTFREVLRNKPCIILADDHDILQGNVWGNAGLDSADPREEGGGFKWDKDLVKMVFRIQHGHNPDSFDDTPIAHGIPVSYGSFIYRGTDFAFVEDRKFKTPPDYETDPLLVKGDLLGERQELFLANWARHNKELPKICLTASMWGSPQTGADGSPLLDYDANGYPPDGRRRAVELVAEAKALVLAGDQHLAVVAHQGLEGYEDGALFFAGPAAAAFWQRWFEGEGRLANQRNSDPNTGNFVDTFGNKMRVLAAANPKISHAEFDRSTDQKGKFLADHRLKSEGYAIVRVDHKRSEFVLECWPGEEDPSNGDQFAGWPVRHPFPNAQS